MIRLIASQELRFLFRSPLTWVIAAISQIIFAWLFLSSLEQYLHIQAKLALRDNAPGVTAYLISNYITPAALLILLFSPLLGMRTFAEERSTGSFLLLRSSPIGLSSIVLGKYLGILGLQALLLFFMFAMPLSLVFFTALDLGSFLAACFGITLFTAACTAVSLYFSLLNKQVLLAAFSAFATLLFLWLLGSGSYSSEASSNWLLSLSLPWHLNSFLKGLLDTRDIAYYLLLSALFLSLSIIRLDSLRYMDAR